MYRLYFCYSEDGKYKDKIGKIKSQLEDIRKKWDVIFEINEASNLSPEQNANLKIKIRNIAPQVRGKIVTSESRILPFSRSKRLNLQNTPILILCQNSTPVNIYPHQLGTTYINVEEALQKIFKEGPENHMQDRGLLEKPIQKIISDNPSILEKGSSFLGLEVDSGTGIADLVLEDSKGRLMVVEVETHANDFAIGQISRLAMGYASKNNVPFEKIRKLIVCMSYDKNLIEGCLGSNVELYILQTNRIC